MKTVYADVLFLINFIINYLVLFTSAHIGAARISKLRLSLGAFIGGVYGVFAYFPVYAFLAFVPTKLTVAVIMVFAAFGYKNIIRMSFIFLLSSLCFGGIVFAAYLIGFGKVCEIKNGVFYIQVPTTLLIISSFCAYFILSLVFRHTGDADRKLCNVEISEGKKRIKLKALFDTGNSLRDPKTNGRVVFAEYATIREILPQSACDILDNTDAKSFCLAVDKLTDCGDFLLLPYRTVSSGFSLLLAFRPERILIDGKRDAALCAISCENFSDGMPYSAIV